MAALFSDDAHTLERLAASDRKTWLQLIAHARSSDACPPELTRAMLAIDDYDGWLRRLFRAYNGLNPDDGMGADCEFQRWFAAGIAATLPADDLRAFELRVRDAESDPAADAAERTRKVVAAIERAHGSSELLGRAYLVLARQLSEDLDQDASIAAARSAEASFAKLGNETWRAQAVRMRGAALLRARKIDEALEVLDSVRDAPSTSFVSSGSRRYEGVVLGNDGRYLPERELESVDAVLYRAGAVAIWAPGNQFEWRMALGTIAKATGHRTCAIRAEGGNEEIDGDDWKIPRQMR